MAFKLINLLLCFNSLTSKCIEIFMIVMSTISIIVGILGIIFIPWEVTSEAMEILFILILLFSVLSLIIASIILYLRNRGKLSKRKKKVLIIAVICMEFICFASLIILIVLCFMLFSDLNKKRHSTIMEVIEETGEVQSINNIEESIAKNWERVLTIVFLSIIIAIWIFLFLLWVSDYVRFIFGIEGSFKEYVANENNRQLKHPIKYGLNVIGHNKYGFPIYGKQVGNKIKIKGAKSTFDEKIGEKINYSGKYFNENGKINVKYYSKYANSTSQEKANERIKEKEKYLEKYYDGENIYQNYTNFENKTILNFDDNNNSINPGYEI